MNDASRLQGRAIAGGAVLLAVLFLIGILNESYWALAVPVAILTFFVLGLAFWVGWTIATIQVEPEPVDEPARPGGDAESAEVAPGPSTAP
jgi:hypothetical protein